MDTIADRLKKYREKKKLSPQKLAEKLKISEELYLSWESGEAEPDKKNLIRLAHILGSTPDELLYGVDISSYPMFPNDATPAVTPISDWRFLCGVLLMFAGGAGVLMFVMRYMGGSDVDTVAKLISVGGVPLIALVSIFLLGLLICVAACVMKAGKNRKHDRRNKNGK